MTCCNHDCKQSRTCPNRGGVDVADGHVILLACAIGFLTAALVALIWVVAP
jgi:hypothetical protein